VPCWRVAKGYVAADGQTPTAFRPVLYPLLLAAPIGRRRFCQVRCNPLEPAGDRSAGPGS